jgi:hypothetical protein
MTTTSVTDNPGGRAPPALLRHALYDLRPSATVSGTSGYVLTAAAALSTPVLLRLAQLILRKPLQYTATSQPEVPRG